MTAYLYHSRNGWRIEGRGGGKEKELEGKEDELEEKEEKPQHGKKEELQGRERDKNWKKM
jgi:hypothetical protein